MEKLTRPSAPSLCTQGYLPRYGPQKCRHFPGDCGHRYLVGFTACNKTTISAAKTKLRLPADFSNLGGQVCTPIAKRSAYPCWKPICPSPLNQYTSSMAVATFSNTSLSSTFSAGMLRRNQSQVRHHLLRVIKPVQVPKFRHQSDGSNHRYSAHRLKGIDNRLHPPRLYSIPNGFCQPFNPAFTLLDAIDIFLEGDLLGGIYKRLVRKPAPVGQRPFLPPAVVSSVTEEKGVQPLFGHPLSNFGIFSSTAQIAHGFVLRARDI